MGPVCSDYRTTRNFTALFKLFLFVFGKLGVYGDFTAHDSRESLVFNELCLYIFSDEGSGP